MLNVSGKIIAFVHEKEFYMNGVPVPVLSLSTTISNKNADGEYSNAYLELKFTKDVAKDWDLDSNDTYEEGDVLDIEIAEAFIGFREYEDNEGARRIVYQLVVTAIESIDYHEQKKEEKPTKKAPTKKAPAKKQQQNKKTSKK